MAQQLNEIMAEIQSLKNANQALTVQEQARGTAYVRWGHASCPNASDTVYSGMIGGSHPGHTGAAPNHLCLPRDPVMDSHPRPNCAPAELYGAEYQTCPEATHNLDPVCAVCHVPRSASIMVAGTNRCWASWTLEYSGYIMGTYKSNPGGSNFICVDSSFGYQAGTSEDHEGMLLHYTAYVCGSLPCPPYQQGKLVVCAVCSK